MILEKLSTSKLLTPERRRARNAGGGQGALDDVNAYGAPGGAWLWRLRQSAPRRKLKGAPHG